ncbi:MAG: phage holin family protein [Acidiferrobacterales bacterium]
MTESESGPRTVGLVKSLRRMLSTLIGILETRVDLVATEIEEQGLRVAQLIALAFLVLFFFTLSVIFGTVAVVVAFWNSNPILVLGGIAVFYLVLAISLGVVWRMRSRARPRLLSATLAELARDREELDPR